MTAKLDFECTSMFGGTHVITIIPKNGNYWLVPGGRLVFQDGDYYFTANDGTVITKECY